MTETIFDGIVPPMAALLKLSATLTVFLKRPGLTGPLWDIYSGPCVLVYGTNTSDKEITAAARHCAQSVLQSEMDGQN